MRHSKQSKKSAVTIQHRTMSKFKHELRPLNLEIIASKPFLQISFQMFLLTEICFVLGNQVFPVRSAQDLEKLKVEGTLKGDALCDFDLTIYPKATYSRVAQAEFEFMASMFRDKINPGCHDHDVQKKEDEKNKKKKAAAKGKASAKSKGKAKAKNSKQ